MRNRKYIHKLADNEYVESAIFTHNHKLHFCVPSQVGCKIGCGFCATTYDDYSSGRKISTDEYRVLLKEMLGFTSGVNLQKIISFSAHGEPCANINHIVEILKDPMCSAFSERHITTILPKRCITAISAMPLDGIYISLHEVTDNAREVLVPHKNLSKISDIIEFVNNINIDNINLNYILLKTNTSRSHAERLISILNQIERPCRLRLMHHSPLINDLIPHIKAAVEIDGFVTQLHSSTVKHKIHIPKLEGVDENMACGQLRSLLSI